MQVEQCWRRHCAALTIRNDNELVCKHSNQRVEIARCPLCKGVQ